MNDKLLRNRLSLAGARNTRIESDENVGACEAKKLDACLRYAVVSPLGHGARINFEQIGHSARPAETVDYLVAIEWQKGVFHDFN